MAEHHGDDEGGEFPPVGGPPAAAADAADPVVPGRLWAEVAPQKKRPVYSANAQQLVAGYADPPTGEELRALFETVTCYEQVPTVVAKET